jgi:hypothetical protein
MITGLAAPVAVDDSWRSREATSVIESLIRAGLFVMEAAATRYPVAHEVFQAENPLTCRSFIAMVRSCWVRLHMLLVADAAGVGAAATVAARTGAAAAVPDEAGTRLLPQPARAAAIASPPAAAKAHDIGYLIVSSLRSCDVDAPGPSADDITCAGHGIRAGIPELTPCS